MSGTVDGRSQQMLRAQLMRRAAALLGPNGATVAPGEIESAFIASAARMFEEVTSRLDKVPEKQADNFYAAMGIGRAPALPARVPVVIKLADTAQDGLVALPRTRFTADTQPNPTVFETEHGIALVRGKVAALAAADFAGDAIYLAPGAVVAPALPAPQHVTRTVRSPVGAGATNIQVDPAIGLTPGMTIRFAADDTPDYDVVAVKNDVVTIAPPLAATVGKDAKVLVVDRFAPFASGARDRQSHAIYFNHPTLLEVPGATTITVAGVESSQALTWEWFGRIGDAQEDSWQAFDRATPGAGYWSLAKPKGKPAKTQVDGVEALWIRARLPGPSAGASPVQGIALAVSSGGLCSARHDQRCTAAGSADAPAVEYDAVAVTTPVVPNKPYYPFGREPRLYDAFYIGCKEAFGKARAEISLCLSLGALGRAVAVAGRIGYYFALGTDDQLYAAQFDGGGTPSFHKMTGPRDGDQPIDLPDQAHLSARVDEDWVRLAIAGTGAVYYTQFPLRFDLKGPIPWVKLPAGVADAAVAMGAVFVSADGRDTVHAMLGADRVMSWQRDATGTFQAQPPEPAHDLIAIQGADAAMLLIDDDGDHQVRIKPGRSPDTVDGPLLARDVLPAVNRAAWSTNREVTGDLLVAGYDAPTGPDAPMMTLVRFDGTDVSPTVEVGRCQPLPITFEPPETGSGAPGIIVATAKPRHFVVQNDAYKDVGGIDDIGDSASPVRQILFAGDRAMVQRWDRGLLYRVVPGGQVQRPLKVRGSARQVAAGAAITVAADYLVDRDRPDGAGYLIVNASGDRLLLPLTDAADTFDTSRRGWLLAPDQESGMIDQTGGTITLLPTTAARASGDIDLLLSIDGQPYGIWRLRPDTNAGEWQQPAGAPPLPDPPTGSTLDYILLQRVASNVSLALSDYFVIEPADVAATARALQAGPLRVSNTDAAVGSLVTFGGQTAFALDHHLVTSNPINLVTASGGWAELGLSTPANPALSWEYWNGTSWWALDTAAFGFSDKTVNLQVSNGIFFKAPEDLRETEVGGRKNLWVRARLVGGDYGEAQVTVSTVDHRNGTTDQTVTRDVSGIRAPYINSLKISYCVVEPVKPAIVLTADNLGTIDQTNANDAGLPVTIFPTVKQALSTQVPPIAAVDDDCCRIIPSADPAPATGQPAASDWPARGILIGFDQPITTTPLSLYVDSGAVPGQDWKVAARIFRAGMFEPATVIDDGSSGLGDSGAITIEIARPPDRTDLFGTSAYWLALSPDPAVAESWSPQLRGIYLNGVMATSAETRTIETIGTSSGAPDQQFRLFANPIDPASLELYIAEPIGEDEQVALGAERDISGMPGPWVPWKLVEEFPADGAPDPRRLFTLDAESGTVTFGNGRNALVPPMGGAVLAKTYRHVAGAAANAVAPGAVLQLVSPIVGVDQVTALDQATGGADVEPAAAARARAPATLANGGRIVTLDDIRRHVLARSPLTAQVRADNWRGGIRLVVVAAADNPVPPLSALKAIGQALHDVATYGSTAPGRLTAIGPRLLPIKIGLQVEPDPGVDWVGTETDARAAIVALLDHRRGGFDGTGWPVGTLPAIDDIAAVLAPFGTSAVISGITVARADGRTMPDPLPADVLVRLDPADVTIAQYEAAAA